MKQIKFSQEDLFLLFKKNRLKNMSMISIEYLWVQETQGWALATYQALYKAPTAQRTSSPSSRRSRHINIWSLHNGLITTGELNNTIKQVTKRPEGKKGLGKISVANSKVLSSSLIISSCISIPEGECTTWFWIFFPASKTKSAAHNQLHKNFHFQCYLYSNPNNILLSFTVITA